MSATSNIWLLFENNKLSCKFLNFSQVGTHRKETLCETKSKIPMLQCNSLFLQTRLILLSAQIFCFKANLLVSNEPLKLGLKTNLFIWSDLITFPSFIKNYFQFNHFWFLEASTSRSRTLTANRVSVPWNAVKLFDCCRGQFCICKDIWCCLQKFLAYTQQRNRQ